MDINIKYASESLVIYIAGSAPLSLSICLARFLILKNVSHCAVLYDVCINRLGMSFFLA